MKEETQEEQIMRCLQEMVDEGLVEVTIGDDGQLLYSSKSTNTQEE